MKEEKKINLHFFAAIYFILFLISVAFNEQKPYLKFPILGPTFANAMATDVFLGVVVGFTIVAMSWLLTRYYRKFRDLSQTVRKLLGPLTSTEIFFIAAFSSLAEEFFFRGLIQGHFGIVFASLLFGMLHTGPGKKYIPWTVFALFMGFVLGWLYEWRQNLMLPVVVHFVVNFINLHLIGQKKTRRVRD